MRKALIVGIDEYPYEIGRLSTCVRDAERMCALLSEHGNGRRNFDCELYTAGEEFISESELRKKIAAFFKQRADVGLFYFSGHGDTDEFGSYLVTLDSQDYNRGVPMADIFNFANKSELVREVIIIVDSCYSGATGSLPFLAWDMTMLREGVSILTASRSNEESKADDEGSLFTSFLCDALEGGAADILGRVTPAQVYAYLDQSFSAWAQRPLFKTNVSRFAILRESEHKIDFDILKKITIYFETPKMEFPLDPSYEPTVKLKRGASPEDKRKKKQKEDIFSHLQKFRALNLVEPVGEEHMYYAAMNKTACRLTRLGRYYWRLLIDKRV